jgi:predicted DNA-binding antitoxin AbrB/MazE fold protein
LSISASETIECEYEGGVFKPVKNVNLEEGTKLKIKIEKVDLSKYYGMFGKASAERLEELEGEVYL